MLMFLIAGYWKLCWDFLGTSDLSVPNCTSAHSLFGHHQPQNSCIFLRNCKHVDSVWIGCSTLHVLPRPTTCFFSTICRIMVFNSFILWHCYFCIRRDRSCKFWALEHKCIFFHFQFSINIHHVIISGDSYW